MTRIKVKVTFKYNIIFGTNLMELYQTLQCAEIKIIIVSFINIIIYTRKLSSG